MGGWRGRQLREKQNSACGDVYGVGHTEGGGVEGKTIAGETELSL